MSQSPTTNPASQSAEEIARRVLRLEASALSAFADSPPADFAKAVDAILKMPGRVIVAGIGKSGHVARKIAATLASTGTPASFVHPTEASHGDLGMITQNDVVIALSKSGETRELSDVVAYTRRFAIPLVGMTAKANSALGKASDFLLLTPDAPEANASAGPKLSRKKNAVTTNIVTSAHATSGSSSRRRKRHMMIDV